MRASLRTTLLLCTILCLLAASPVQSALEFYSENDGFTDRTWGPIHEQASPYWFLRSEATEGVLGYDGVAWRVLGTPEVLPDPDFTSFFVDHRGWIWVGTGAGVARFDGSHWVAYRQEDGLTHPRVTSIIEDRAGQVWVCGSGLDGWSIYRFDGTSFVTERTATEFANIGPVLRDTDGRLYFFNHSTWTSEVWDGTSWTSLALPEPVGSIQALAADSSGGIWLSVNTGSQGVLFRSEGAGWELISGTPGFFESVVTTPDGNVWVTTPDGLRRYDGTTWSLHTGPGFGAWSPIVDRWGHLWLWSYRGPVRFDGTSWRTFNEADGIARASDVRPRGEDGAGGLWFDAIGGLLRYDGTRSRTYTSADGLPSDDVEYGITEDRTGRLWFATRENGLASYDFKTWRTYGYGNGLPSNGVRNVHCDRSGRVWVATQGGGISRFDSTDTWTWYDFRPYPGGPPERTNFILEDALGDLLLGNDDGVYRYDGSSWVEDLEADSLLKDTHEPLARVEPFAAIASPDGPLWVQANIETYGQPVRCCKILKYDGRSWSPVPSGPPVKLKLGDRWGGFWGTESGALWRFDGTSWRSYTTADGLSGDLVSALALDSLGHVWAATYHEDLGSGARSQTGLSRFDGSAWASIPVVNEVSSPPGIIRFDRYGVLWGLSGGVNRFDGSEWVRVTRDDGQPFANVHTITETRSGDLWFGGNDIGAVEHEPDRTPPVAVLTAKPGIATADASPEFTFGAAFREVRGIEFSHRLDHGIWSEWSASTSWKATQVPDGPHIFEVQARDRVHVTGFTPTRHSFETDATPPVPTITRPAFGEAVRGIISIEGTSFDARFLNSRIEARPSGSAWTSPSTILLQQSIQPERESTLANWDTTDLRDGVYDVRIVVADSLGLSGTALISVIVDNQAPFANVTSPARVPSSSGGDVFTTSGSWHLYFPPRAFEEDALVTLMPLSAESLEVGAGTVLDPGYEVAWSGSSLKKSSQLTVRLGGGTSAQGSKAFYYSARSTTWSRLGGTLDPERQTLTALIREPGRYIVAAEMSAPAEGAESISPISLVPRVFSPAGRYANDQITIGFTLGRSAPVTVRIYNRGGRLVREVLSDEIQPSGANVTRWDGRDGAGATVADGIYLVTVQAAGQTQRTTIAVVR